MKKQYIATLGASALLLCATSANAGKKGGATDSCGYPNGKAPAPSSVIFSESESLLDFDGTGGTIKAWYTDEHALTLGVRQVIVKTKTGTVTTDYTVTPYTSSAQSAVNPAVGTTSLIGSQAGTDIATWNSAYGMLDHGRPMWPALFITDITLNPSSTQGDWQQSGISAIAPNAVYGTWKGAVKTVDQTRTPWVITTTPDADPAKNFWQGIPDMPPSGFGNNGGYTSELVWNLNSLGLISGHNYRFQFMVHDGDQNKAGGDAGEACVVFTPPQVRL